MTLRILVFGIVPYTLGRVPYTLGMVMYEGHRSTRFRPAMNASASAIVGYPS